MTSDVQELLETRCRSRAQLWWWVRTFLGLQVPRRAVCPDHIAPFEYLMRAYFEPGQDLVVWAPRGGGKTRLGAVATLLDLLHKPRTTVRILGGSLEQSLRMWEHLLGDVEQIAVGTKQTGARLIRLDNRSHAAVLTQSQRAVRGQRVQKLRCDEVELFEPEIWEAAQLVTRSLRVESTDGRAPAVHGAVEAVSTMHNVGGLMSRIVDAAEKENKPILRWCLMEVLQRCEPERDCGTCPLWDDCRGRAKTACEGFLPIDDAIAMKQRVSVRTWESEMLCRRPSVQWAVFPMFDRAIHVAEGDPETGAISLAMDFGFANPFVCLWIAMRGEMVHVIDEYVQSQRTIHEHLAEIERRGWPTDRRIACDPAGAARNEQTAMSNITYLRSRGYTVRWRASHIVEGIEMIRAALKPAWGRPTLLIHPRCVHLIAALEGYAYHDTGSEVPLKDGVHDHLIDALRYWMINQHARRVVARSY